MTADLSGATAVKAVAAALSCSPCPKVFTTHQGYETFSSQFVIEWQDRSGSQHQLTLTRGIYERIRGPYGRRKIFEAVIVHWPLASTNPRVRPMFASISKYGLTGRAPLLHELGIAPQTVSGPVRIRVVPRAGADFINLPHYLDTSLL